MCCFESGRKRMAENVSCSLFGNFFQHRRGLLNRNTQQFNHPEINPKFQYLYQQNIWGKFPNIHVSF